ncbi:MAG: caspase family protein [Bacteroidota bacterium]
MSDENKRPPRPNEPEPDPSPPDKPWPPVGKSRKIFALLAGIDRYPDSAALIGCIKDVENVENYLRTQVHQQLELAPGIRVEANDELYLCSLKNEQATYKNIITGFRKFLCFADGDDIVWFHFSGHGTQQLTAREFRDEEANDKDQALVCFYESKEQEQQFLLADKELGKLIEEVNTQNANGEIVDKGSPHIIITLDCCHSGTGTRSGDEVVAARALTLELPPRQMDSYLNTDGESTFGSPKIRRSKHIAIAACQSTEKAIDSESGGLFTNAMLRALQESGGEICYADLTSQIDLLMQQHKAEFLVSLISTPQTPQYDAIGDFNVFAKFLHPKSIIGRKDLYDVYFDGLDWMIKCGAIHSLPESGEHNIGVSVLLEGKVVANTSIKKVSAFESSLHPFEEQGEDSEEEQQKETRYKARLINLPAKKISVFLEGDAFGLEILLNHWDDSKNILSTQEENEKNKYQITADNGHYTIHYLANDTQERFTTQAIAGEAYDSNRIAATLGALERIAHWERFFNLNRSNSVIPSLIEPTLKVATQGNQAPMIFTESTVLLDIPTAHFEERAKGGIRWRLLNFNCDAKIDTAQSKEKKMDLHFYFLHLGSDYSINNWVYKADEFEENREQEEILHLLVDAKSRWGLPEPKNEDRWRFKLLVTTQAIKIEALEQSGLGGTKSEAFGDPVGSSEDWCAFDFDVHLRHQGGPG